MSWPMISVALFIAMMAVAVLVIVAMGVRDAYRRGFPSLACEQRQTLALLALALGEFALTLLWVALYAYDFHVVHLHGQASALAQAGQKYIWRLMAAHAGAMMFIAIGDVVSARIGDWFEIKRKGTDT